MNDNALLAPELPALDQMGMDELLQEEHRLWTALLCLDLTEEVGLQVCEALDRIGAHIGSRLWPLKGGGPHGN